MIVCFSIFANFRTTYQMDTKFRTHVFIENRRMLVILFTNLYIFLNRVAHTEIYF